MKYCCLSFDDGRKDFYDTVFPILKEENIAATLNVIPDYLAHPVSADYHFPSGNNEGITIDHAREIYASGIEIASHSYDHTNTIESIEKASGALAKLFPEAEPFGFASPNSHICQANIDEYRELLQSKTVDYVRSGNQLRRDGYGQCLLYLLAQWTGSPFLFYLYHKKHYVEMSGQYDFYPSAAAHAHTSAKQIIGLFDRMQDNQALILMFHSVLHRSDAGYGKDKWYTDIDDLKAIIHAIKELGGITFITNKQLHVLMKAQPQEESTAR